MTIVLAMVAQAMDGLNELGKDGETEARLAAGGNRAVREVLSDLKRSGFVSVGGLDYPQLFLNGDAGPDFPLHDHVPATPLEDYGGIGSREIIFLLPADADDDGIPDIDADGDLVWDAREFSYVLETGQDGVNRLIRRIDGVDDSTVARDVDRIIIDNDITSGFAIPGNALRVRVDMATPSGADSTHTMTLQGVVRARNGG